MIPLPGVGTVIRIIRGESEGKKLRGQRDRLHAMILTDPLALVTPSFRRFAAVLITFAKRDAGLLPSQPGDDTNDYEQLRSYTVDMLLENSSSDPASRADIVGLKHTLSNFAHHANESVSGLETQMKAHLDRNDGRLAQANSALQSLQKDGAATRELVNAMTSEVARVDASAKQNDEAIRADMDAARNRMQICENRVHGLEATSTRLRTELGLTSSAIDTLSIDTKESVRLIRTQAIVVEQRTNATHSQLQTQSRDLVSLSRKSQTWLVALSALATLQSAALLFLLFR